MCINRSYTVQCPPSWRQACSSCIFFSRISSWNVVLHVTFLAILADSYGGWGPVRGQLTCIYATSPSTHNTSPTCTIRMSATSYPLLHWWPFQTAYERLCGVHGRNKDAKNWRKRIRVCIILNWERDLGPSGRLWATPIKTLINWLHANYEIGSMHTSLQLISNSKI